MTLDNLIPKQTTATILGKDYNVNFKIRNFAALKNIHNISENELLEALVKGNISIIPYAVWCSTLIFAPFTPANPTEIKEQIELEDLFNLDLTDLKGINDKLVEAMMSSLPKQKEEAKTVEKKPKKAIETK